MARAEAARIRKLKKEPLLRRLKKDILKNPYIYLMLLPVLAYYILFCYKPM